MGTLRFFLALSVAFAHSKTLTGKTVFLDAHISVTIFFLFSGFLIAFVLENKYENQIVNFYRNRFIRIFVPFFIISIGIEVTYFIFANYPKLIYIQTHQYDFAHMFLLYFSNFFLFGSEIVHLLSTRQNLLSENLIIPQSWTLPLELYFYILAPLLISSGFRLVLVFLLSFLFYIYTYYTSNFKWLDYSFLTNLYFFVGGSIVYRISKKLDLDYFHKVLSKNQLKFNSIYIISVLSLILFMIFSRQFINQGNRLVLIFYYMLTALILPYIFYGNIYLNKNIKKVDKLLGNLSYYLYLIHIFIMLVLVKTNILVLNIHLTYVAFLSIASYFAYLIIDPFEKKLRLYK